MTKTVWLVLGLMTLVGLQSANAQSVSEAGLTSDRIRVAGGSGSADLYGSGNDDAFQSFGAVTFNLTAADFGLTTVADIQDVNLNLTFNDRGFSDGSQFELFFTADDFVADGENQYAGLTYDVTAEPSGVNASQFTSLTSLGVYDTGFDLTDETLGGTAFDYALNIDAVRTELTAEINAGSDFTLLLAAVDNADDITFSGVGNTFDAGDPTITVTAIPEPASGSILALIALAGFSRRRR